MKFKEDGQTYNLSQMEINQEEPQIPFLPPRKTWAPNGETHTHPYGQGFTKPTPSFKEIAHLKAEEDYPYLMKNDPIVNKRAKVIEKMMSNG